MKKLTLVMAAAWIACAPLSALASDGAEALMRWHEAFHKEQHRQQTAPRQDAASKRNDSPTQPIDKPGRR